MQEDSLRGLILGFIEADFYVASFLCFCGIVQGLQDLRIVHRSKLKKFATFDHPFAKVLTKKYFQRFMNISARC